MENKPQSHAELKPLLPCPFCGGKAEGLCNFNNKDYVVCTECGVTQSLCDNAILATEQWNTRHVSAHTAPLVAALRELCRAVGIFTEHPLPTDAWLQMTNLDRKQFNEMSEAVTRGRQALAGQPTPPAPQAVSRTAYELAGQFTYGGNDYDAAAKLIQQALDAQHAKTWAMAVEAAAQSLKDKMFYDRDLEIVEGKMQRDIRALPCPPLEKEGA